MELSELYLNVTIGRFQQKDCKSIIKWYFSLLAWCFY